ncbi:uncharacterized protein LOC135487561 isoform X2 [Lineus longissimus]|uniref:uncharacterized protein LOC135487561 isoform X2 n=1 Tax=Lineus longissimus TaxID=88925 RepID=UPI00315CF215
MGTSKGLAFLLLALLQSTRHSDCERVSKCMDKVVEFSCPRNEVIWIKDAYSCKKCEGTKCVGSRHESSDVNLLWDLCNLRDVCDLKVTWYRLDLDYECVPLQQIPMYNICTNAEIKKNAFYLFSPGYPKDLSNNRHCECSTELKKPTNFSVTIHHGRFQSPELEIKLDNFVRGPLGVTNLPIPKEEFKVVYTNNKDNTDHRLWMKILVNEDITLTCRDVKAMQVGLTIAMIFVGCIVGTLCILIPAALIYRRKRRQVIKAAEVGVGSHGSSKGDHVRDKMMLNLYGPEHQGPKQNGGVKVAQTELGVMKVNDLYGSGEDVPGNRESHAYQVAGFHLKDKDVCGRYKRGSNVYAYADLKGDAGNSHMKENDLYQPTEFTGNNGGGQPNVSTGETSHMKENDLYQSADVGSGVLHNDDDLFHMKENDLYQPTDFNGDGYMKDNDLYTPADVTGYNRRPRSLPRPRTLPKPKALPKPMRKSEHGDSDAPTTLPKPTRVSEEIYQDIGQ